MSFTRNGQTTSATTSKGGRAVWKQGGSRSYSNFLPSLSLISVSALQWMRQQRDSSSRPTSCALCKAPCSSSDMRTFIFDPMARVRALMQRFEQQQEADMVEEEEKWKKHHDEKE